MKDPTVLTNTHFLKSILKSMTSTSSYKFHYLQVQDSGLVAWFYIPSLSISLIMSHCHLESITTPFQ